MNVLISAAGRRVRLVQLFQEAAQRLGLPVRVVACDAGRMSAAAHVADEHFVVPAANDLKHIPEVLRRCEERDVRLVVSVNDHELVPYAEARARFEEAGVHVAIASAEAVRMSRDKRATHEWLAAHGLPVPRQWRADSLPASLPFPLIVKPSQGSAGIGVREVRSHRELAAAVNDTSNATIEEKLEGREFTVNVFAARDGRFVCAVPHLRLEVRAGEVSKGRTFRDEKLDRVARHLVTILPGCRGVFNFQGFLRDDGEVRLTEINARFGGGYPLAHAAGARFPDWMLLEMHGREIPREFTEWQPEVVMLRYDDEIILRPETTPHRRTRPGC